MDPAPVMIVSNRGPNPAGAGGARGSEAGGLVSALSFALSEDDVRWLCCANMFGDCATSAPAGEFYVKLDEPTFELAYNVVANTTLWFCHHHIMPSVADPSFDSDWWEAWDAYVEYNRAFARAVCEHARENEVVFFQDYHLSLAPGYVKAERPELKVLHFSHTPFAGEAFLNCLPESVKHGIVAALCSCDLVGFHTERWKDCFLAAVRSEGLRAPVTFALPLGPDTNRLQELTSEQDVAKAAFSLASLKEDGFRLVVRVDRLEPAKNLLRGFRAYEEVLRRASPRVRFLALLNPSRETVPIYKEYRAAVEREVEEINARWRGVLGFDPIILKIQNDLAFSLAAMSLADVLVANSVRDGLNLVVKEAPLISSGSLRMVVSKEVGAYEEMKDVVIGVNPYDVSEQAVAIEQALEMPERTAGERLEGARQIAAKRSARDWLDQIRALAS